jgi:hypothetical protein
MSLFMIDSRRRGAPAFGKLRESGILFSLYTGTHVNKGFESAIAKRAMTQGKQTFSGQNSVEFRPPNATT